MIGEFSANPVHESPSGLAFGRVQAELLPTLRKASVPIYGWQGRQILDRTSVFVRIQDEHFLLTAAHGQLNEKAARIPLAIGWDDESESRILLEHFTIHKSSDEGTLDVAVIELPSNIAARLSKQYGPVLLREIEPTPTRRDGVFLLFGYPEHSADADRFVEPLAVAFFSERYTGELDPINPQIQFNPRAHLAIEIKRNAVHLENGEPIRLQKMQGVSGCGIWRVADSLESFVEHFQPAKVKLVAIQNVWHAGMGYGVGTWVYYAMEILFRSHPHLAPARKLVYPR